MTTVTFEKDPNGNYKAFTCFGHAGFAKKRRDGYEPDILCAAISALTENVINGLGELAGENLTVDANEETGFIHCVINAELKAASVLLVDSYVLSLTNLSDQYGKKYLTVNFKEVR